MGSNDHHIYVFDQGGHLKNIFGSMGSGDSQSYGHIHHRRGDVYC